MIHALSLNSSHDSRKGTFHRDRHVLSVNTEPEIRDRLERLVTVTRRSKSLPANEAIERHVVAEGEFVERIEACMAEAETREFIPSDELRSRFKTRMEVKFRPAIS